MLKIVFNTCIIIFGLILGWVYYIFTYYVFTSTVLTSTLGEVRPCTRVYTFGYTLGYILGSGFTYAFIYYYAYLLISEAVCLVFNCARPVFLERIREGVGWLFILLCSAICNY